MAVLFITAKTANNPNVYQQEKGRAHHVFDGIFYNDTERGVAYPAQWKMRNSTEDAPGRTTATCEESKGARAEGSTPPPDGSRESYCFLFPFSEICTVIAFIILKTHSVIIKKQRPQWSPEEPTH